MSIPNTPHLKPWTLLPAPKDTCPQCAVNHDQSQPHNQQSLFYQYAFYGENGRWPTWKDAMSHCTPEVQKLWTEALKNEGVKL